ncbi:hypothetical protein DQ04_03961060 [Trypanosoma grayi]|uniref:hypothetical protein n=1 Tax=Trypanosoma grayi TaxID=71804 RepID=UPI0004F42C92|nr:hypothetical protein DQ04_03961060 [Trypanosoma grayi]KEG10267.1 hypothetical protein DQ04_03961060 [Trypanosoma grayi]
MHSDAAAIYVEACNREHAECALELVYAFENNEKEVSLSDRAVHLNDIDVSCIAEALRITTHPLRVLNIEGNAFGLPGLQALLEAVEENPGIVRELRLGRNKLKDQAAVVIGHTLSRDGCGLKVLDLSENEITNLGVIPIAAALANESCDIVELSFHNNKIEADAATFLGQAIRQAGKLKHLHLGYNAIRDTGAAQFAQCIPVTVSLSTLDLTANRIGPSGGKELARALMTSTCNIQRLNLRHNLFDSETIEMYAEVLQRNTSLIQLFLGFMNPTPDSAAVVLSALRANRTLLLLDIYGWKLHPESVWEIIDSIQKSNNTLAAIVTDACQPIAKYIDDGNEERDERGQHPIYVGPDDRDAYVATTSLRRFSRAQSRRHSRASSRGAMSSRTGSPSHRRQHERSHSHKDSDTHSRHSSRGPQEHNYSFPQNDSVQKAVQQQQQPPPPPPPPPPSMREEQYYQRESGASRNGVTEVLLQELYRSQLDQKTSETIRRIVEHLQQELGEQRQRQKTLEARVAALERRRECLCGSNPLGSADLGMVSRITGKNSASSPHDHAEDAPTNRDPSGHGNYAKGSRSCASGVRTPPPNFTGLQQQGQSVQQLRSTEPFQHGSIYDGDGYKRTHSAKDTSEQRGSSVHERNYRRSVSVHSGGTCGGPAELPQTCQNRTERSEPPAEPLELPRERKPPEVSLQTSTKPNDGYQPHLSPAPLKDANPPKRKGSVQRL